jgi:hypothetical protein
MPSASREAVQAVKHCERLIARLRAKIEECKAVGADIDAHQRCLDTLWGARAAHVLQRDRFQAA